MRVADSSYDSLFPFRCTLLPFPYKLNLAYRAPPPPPRLGDLSCLYLFFCRLNTRFRFAHSHITSKDEPVCMPAIASVRHLIEVEVHFGVYIGVS